MMEPLFAEHLRLPGGVWRMLAAVFAFLEFITYEFVLVATCLHLAAHDSHLKNCGEDGDHCLVVLPIGAQIFDAFVFFLVLFADLVVFISIGNEDHFWLRVGIYIHYGLVLINIMRFLGRAIKGLWLKVVLVAIELGIQWVSIVVFICYYWELRQKK